MGYFTIEEKEERNYFNNYYNKNINFVDIDRKCL